MVVPGWPYHIIQRGNNRQVVFFEDEDREEYLGLLKRYSQQWNCPVLAYCLMTNHIHLLIEVRSDQGLAKLMQGISLCYTQKVNKKYQRTGRLWECRHHSCLVERDRYLWVIFRYIERNPVRAGLVEKAEHYQWSSARAHILGEDNSVLSEGYLFRERDHQNYSNFLQEDEAQRELDSIRQMTRQGRPLGTLKFQQHIEKTLKRKLVPLPRGRPKKIK